MELELTNIPFSHLTRYFDFDALQKEKGTEINSRLRGDFFEDYLDHAPQALAELPAEVRAKLTEGLKLESLVQSAAQGSAPQAPPPGQVHPPKPLVNSEGKSLSPGSGIVLPDPAPAGASDRKILLSEPPKLEARPLALPDSASRVQEWQTLKNRWRALGFETQAKLVRWENLSSKHKAEIGIFEASAHLKLKADLPAAERALFERLNWSKDQDAMEFRHTEPLADPEAMLQDLKLLSQRAGVDRRIFDPTQGSLPTASLHYHMSVPGRDLTRIAELLNDRLMLGRVSQGLIWDLGDKVSWVYQEDLSKKGLLRLLGSKNGELANRIEIRVHNGPLREELANYLRLLSLPEEEALRDLRAEIASLLNDETVRRLARFNLSLLERRFSAYLTPEQKAGLAPLQARAQFVQGLKDKKRWQANDWKQVLEVLQGDDRELIAKLPHPNRPVPEWFTREVVLSLRKIQHPDKVATTVANWPHSPAIVFDEAMALMRDPSPVFRQAGAILLMNKRRALPPSAEDRLLDMLQNIPPDETRFFEVLGNRPWPAELWNKILHKLENWPTDRFTENLLTAIRYQQEAPEAARDWFARKLETAKPSLQVKILKHFSETQARPPSLQSAVRKLHEQSRAQPLPRPLHLQLLHLAASGRVWDHEDWELAIRGVSSTDQDLARGIMALAVFQGAPPEEAWPAIVKRLRLKDSSAAFIAATHPAPPRFTAEVQAILQELVRTNEILGCMQRFSGLGNASAPPLY